MSLVKKRTTKWVSGITLIFCLTLFPMAESIGQTKGYPDKPIQIFVGTTPGGVADLWTRAWSNDFSKILNTPVVVVNKAGASGMAALIEGAVAPPDGYTLSWVSTSILIGMAITEKPSFDLFKDFVPIGSFGNFPTIIAVEKDSPFATLEDLMAYARKNPKKLKCGTAGSTIISHFTFECLKIHTKMDVTMVPFKGSPPAITALLGKHVDLLSLSPAGLVGLVKAGRVRALVATRKLKEIPQVPTFAEKGLTEAEIPAWAGLLAPSGISKEIHGKLVDSFLKISKDPAIIQRLEGMDFIPDYQTPAEFTVQFKKDYEKIKSVAQEAGIKE